MPRVQGVLGRFRRGLPDICIWSLWDTAAVRLRRIKRGEGTDTSRRERSSSTTVLSVFSDEVSVLDFDSILVLGTTSSGDDRASSEKIARGGRLWDRRPCEVQARY